MEIAIERRESSRSVHRAMDVHRHRDRRKSRWWEVRDAAGELVCLTTAAARARWCAG
jgi:hypothetical protein